MYQSAKNQNKQHTFILVNKLISLFHSISDIHKNKI